MHTAVLRCVRRAVYAVLCTPCAVLGHDYPPPPWDRLHALVAARSRRADTVLFLDAAATARVQEAEQQEEEKRRRERAERAAREERERPLRRVARCIAERGYTMTRPQFGFQKNKGAFLPWLEGHSGSGTPPLGALHFPMMLYYPEASPYHDTIEDVCETDTIRAHLDAVCTLTPTAQPPPASFPTCSTAASNTLGGQLPGWCYGFGRRASGVSIRFKH